jgi:hypothetical protein
MTLGFRSWLVRMGASAVSIKDEVSVLTRRRHPACRRGLSWRSAPYHYALWARDEATTTAPERALQFCGKGARQDMPPRAEIQAAGRVCQQTMRMERPAEIAGPAGQARRLT